MITWYKGTISPEEFDSYGLGVFNDYEIKNMDKLKSREYSLSANGYQLDAN